MIITQTPVRISFLGGGTDYPAHYRRFGGETLACSINKYTYVTLHTVTRFADYRLRVHYSQVESAKTLDEIQHPSARECLRFMQIDGGVEVHYVSDLPARTGLGSSSSATVGLLHALHAFKGQIASREQLAAEAVFVEQDLIRERVGSQDQYASALGGILHLRFREDGPVQADRIPLSRQKMDEMRGHMVLLYTGVQRQAHVILEEQVARTEAGENTACLQEMRELVKRGTATLADWDLIRFGEILHESWLLKRRLSSRISNPWIDGLYERGRQAGAIGGKLLGAGAGGFLLLWVPPTRRSNVCQALAELQEADFAFDHSGSQVIFYQT